MRIMLLLALSLCISGISYAQSADTFASIQKLLNKANGKKIMNLVGKDEKIGKQIFTESAISIEITGQGKYSSTWIHDYSNINWSGFNWYLWNERSNDKLQILRIEFKKPVSHTMHEKGEQGDSNTRSSIDLYFLAKDYSEMESLFKNATK